MLWDDDGNGVSDPNERAVLARAPGINHAVIIHKGESGKSLIVFPWRIALTVSWFKDYVYASSASTVFRWPYRAGLRRDLGAPEVSPPSSRNLAPVRAH